MVENSKNTSNSSKRQKYIPPNQSLASKRIHELHKEWLEYHQSVDFDQFVIMHSIIGIENHLYSISNFGVGNSKRIRNED
jgi:hypothetical protein